MGCPYHRLLGKASTLWPEFSLRLNTIISRNCEESVKAIIARFDFQLLVKSFKLLAAKRRKKSIERMYGAFGCKQLQTLSSLVTHGSAANAELNELLDDLPTIWEVLPSELKVALVDGAESFAVTHTCQWDMRCTSVLLGSAKLCGLAFEIYVDSCKDDTSWAWR